MKKIFLTGASAGIGLATAKALVAAGYEVWGTSRDPRRLPELSGLHPVTLDLADIASTRQSFITAQNDAGHFDVVINNAGSGHFGPAEMLASEVWQAQLQILVVAQIEICRLALESMRKQERGLIINVSSLAARLPMPFMSAYNAAKAAMASFTMTLQLELPSSSNIRVVDFQPADINTDFNDSVLKAAGSDPGSAAAMAQTWRIMEQNMKAAPGPELVARAILKLIGQTNPPARVTAGAPFQAKIAPLLFRFLPQRVRLWGLKKYYKL